MVANVEQDISTISFKYYFFNAPDDFYFKIYSVLRDFHIVNIRWVSAIAIKIG